MSFKKKTLLIALATALAVVVGLNLSALQHTVGAMASAVWGS